MKSKGYRLHPATLFLVLTLLVAIVVWLLDIYGVSVLNPSTNGYLQVQSLFNAEGSRWLLRNMISNFGAFAPIGMVVVSLLGLGEPNIVASYRLFVAEFRNRVNTQGKLLSLSLSL